MTSSKWDIFHVTGLLCGEFPSQRPVTRSFNVFFYLCLDKLLSKQSRHWWFETPSRPLLRRCNGLLELVMVSDMDINIRINWAQQPLLSTLYIKTGCQLLLCDSSTIWRVSWQKQLYQGVWTSNYIPEYLWDVITCPCPWYLLLAPFLVYHVMLRLILIFVHPDLLFYTQTIPLYALL